MKKKEVRPAELQPLGGVYRVPSRSVFRKTHTKGDASWDDIYSKVKCLKCKKHFTEGDAYKVVVTLKKNKEGNETFETRHKYQHIDCTST